MTRRCDKTTLTRLVNALNERPWQAELDELGFSLFLPLVVRGNGSTLVDQGFDLMLGHAGIRGFGFRSAS